MPADRLPDAIDFPTVLLLFGLMVLSARFAALAFTTRRLHGSLAGNFLLVGSIANLIVVERAATVGVRLSFADHARSGIPITLLSMGVAVAWLYGIGAMTW